MIGLLQRVRQASVDVEGRRVAEIAHGLMVLVAVRRTDTAADAERLAERVLNYRVFADQQGRMNESLLDVGGELLLVPQFTLAADTRKGRRASFTGAAAPETGRACFEQMLACCREHVPRVESGQFGAHMQVALVNDGPVTFWLES